MWGIGKSMSIPCSLSRSWVSHLFLWHFLWKHNPSISERPKLDYFIVWPRVLKSLITVPSNKSVRRSHHEESLTVKQTPYILTVVLCIATTCCPQSSPFLQPVMRESMSIIEVWPQDVPKLSIIGTSDYCWAPQKWENIFFPNYALTSGPWHKSIYS